MPDENDTLSPEVNLAIEKTSGIKAGVPTDTDGPLYRIYEDAKIPVSKQLGPLWQSRIDQGKSVRTDTELCWSEAIRYYDNDQMLHRGTTGSGNQSGNRRWQRTNNEQWSETENIVFSNATTMLPMLYAKNPAVEMTALNPSVNEKFADCCEKLINAILNMKTEPGLNMKSKARRGVLWALLTNNAYMKVDFIRKQESSEAAVAELNKLSEAYSTAKTKKEIKQIEGQLKALEEKISFLSPSGPKVCLTSPFRLVADPTGIEPDHTDANWMAEFCHLQTDYLNAVYGKDKEGQIVSVYEPTHVLKGSTDGSDVQDEINNFSIFKPDPAAAAKNYGYASDEAFRNSCYTKCWWIWDKTTRRVFLYAENKWSWPLWVWDDPLKLLEFFPYSHLHFHETLEGSQPKGEVTYYLDQQDAINDINSEVARMRRWVKNNIFYDRNKISQDDAEKVLTGPDGTARGVDVPEGGKLTDVIFSFPPPSMQHPELYDTASKFAAVNRVTGISDAQKGAQFKTNTTNDAIDFYQKNVDIRVDEKIDAIEDWIGDIGWKVLQILCREWTTDDVANVIGADHAQHWQQITDPNELRTKLSMKVVGGSTDKPTGKAKKKAALEIGQVIGQFANSIPAAGIVVLKVFERAFNDDITITQDDWDMIFKTMEQQQQKAGAGPGGAADGGEAAPPDEAQIRQAIEKLSPEQKQQMQQLVQKGVSPTEALKQVAQQQAGGQQPPVQH